MSLPAAWVDALFSRLSVRYGDTFFRQYDGIDPQAVKADWAEVLDGTSGHSIEYALKNLPSDWPPTALKFRDLCRMAPAKPVPVEQRIGYQAEPEVEADPSRVAEIMDRIRQRAEQEKRDGLTPAEKCYLYIRQITTGARPSPAQKHQIDAMRAAGLLRRFEKTEDAA